MAGNPIKYYNKIITENDPDIILSRLLLGDFLLLECKGYWMAEYTIACIAGPFWEDDLRDESYKIWLPREEQLSSGKYGVTYYRGYPAYLRKVTLDDIIGVIKENYPEWEYK